MPSVIAKDPGLNLEHTRSPMCRAEETAQARDGSITEVPPATDCTEVRPEEGPGYLLAIGRPLSSQWGSREEGQTGHNMAPCSVVTISLHSCATVRLEKSQVPGLKADSRNVSHLYFPVQGDTQTVAG